MEALELLLRRFIAFVPNIMGALLILVVGYILSRLITTVLKRLLVAVGIDKLGEKLAEIDVIARSGAEVSLSTVLSRVLYYLLMLIVAVAATDVLGMEIVSALVASAIAYVPDLIAAMVLLVVGAILADALREIATATCRGVGIPAARMIGSLVFWFVFVAIAVTALTQARLETDFIVANLSIVLGGFALAFALAYGLAARPLMGGFLAQFYNRGKVNPGDRIAIDGHEGVVGVIDRASLTLEADDGRIVIVPLSRLQSETVVVIERALGSRTFIAEGDG